MSRRGLQRRELWAWLSSALALTQTRSWQLHSPEAAFSSVVAVSRRTCSFVSSAIVALFARRTRSLYTAPSLSVDVDECRRYQLLHFALSCRRFYLPTGQLLFIFFSFISQLLSIVSFLFLISGIEPVSATAFECTLTFGISSVRRLSKA